MTEPVHSLLPQPENPEATVWKYMDLPELICLLQERQLWFSRLDTLGDPFEGAVEEAVLDTVPAPEAAELPEAAKPNLAVFQKQALRNFLLAQRLSMCVCCWTEEEDELMALWRSYGRSVFSVAIRSRYDILTRQVQSRAHVGRVYYTDFQQEVDKEEIKSALFYYAVRKHAAFKFEREIRAIYQGRNVTTVMESINAAMKAQVGDGAIMRQIPSPRPEDIAKLPKGEGIPVDINELVLEIRRNPICPDWFAPQLEKVCRKLGYTNAISPSAIDARTWHFAQ